MIRQVVFWVAALLAMLLPALVLGITTELESRCSDAGTGTSIDDPDFSDPNFDYASWVNGQVASGKARWASESTAVLVAEDRSGWRATLKGIWCGGVVAPKWRWDMGRAAACKWMKPTVTLYTTYMELFEVDALCDDDRTCYLTASVSFQVAGYMSDYLQHFCTSGFDRIYQNCVTDDDDGGGAEIELHAPDGSTHIGHVSIGFHEGKGEDKTCPADNWNRKCKKVPF